MQTIEQAPVSATAADRVYGQIKRAILSGKYPPGAPVREAALGREFGLSRTPIREALQRLISEGWAEAVPHQGARITVWDDGDIEEVFELRTLLEPHVVKRAASRISAAQLAELTQLAERMEALTERPDDAARDQITELNRRFHHCLLVAAESPRLQRLIEFVAQVPVARRSFQEYTAEEMQRSMRHHRELISALSVRDGEWARSVMSAHLLSARTAQLRVALGKNECEQVG